MATADPDGALLRAYRRATFASVLGLVVNLLLAVVKLVAGVLGQSIALVADAMNSIGDSVSGGATLYALHVAQRPPDREHPYGHSRAEAVAALSMAVLIAAGAAAIGVEAIGSIARKHEVAPLWTLWIAAGNVVIKEAMFQYKKRAAKLSRSGAVIAAAWDHRSDAFASLAVLVGLSVMHIGGPAVIWADEAAALVVVVLVLAAAYQLFRTNASQLMDAQVEPELIARIRRIAEDTPQVRRVEQVRARRSGIEVFVDIHIEVDAGISVADGHHVAHLVKDRLITQLTFVTQVLVHVEPAHA